MRGSDCDCNGSGPNTGFRENDSNVGPAIDASRVLFRVGASSKVSDALHAISMVKASPVIGSVTAADAASMSVQVQRMVSVPQPKSYTIASNDVEDVRGALDSVQTFTLARLGGRVRVATIDQRVTVAGSSQDFADLQLQNAAIGLLRRLDREIGRGEDGGANPGFDGLSQLAAGRTSVSTDLATDLRHLMTLITPNGSAGTGEGIDCFFGGPLMLRRLIALSISQSNAGEWKRDTRTGRLVFHYLGIPYYRTDAVEEATTTGGRIFGANLGPTGLQLLHAFGTSDSFGIVAEETPVTAATGTREITVHGAWTLVLWEPEALYELTSIDLTSL